MARDGKISPDEAAEIAMIPPFFKNVSRFAV
jgi:hypothetical protein